MSVHSLFERQAQSVAGFAGRIAFGAILLAAVLVFSGIATAQEQSTWKAGVAAVKVTPPGPIWQVGFAARSKGPSEGIDTDLYVKALAIQDGSNKPLVIVTSDLIGFQKDLAVIIAERCQKKYGIERDHLVLNSSHTHGGPSLSLDEQPRGSKRTPAEQKVVVDYTKGVLDKVVDVVGRSVENLSPAVLQFDQGLAGFAVNRRRSRPNTRQFPGPVDQDVPVLAVRSPNGDLKAILFGYACHATTLETYKINADYPGYAQTALEKMHPGAIAMFMQGCGADSNPLPRFHSNDPQLIGYSMELCQMYGKVLAFAVEAVLRGKMNPVKGPLATALEYVDVPFEPLPSRQLLQERLKTTEENRRSQVEKLIKALDEGKKLPERYPYPIQVCYFGSGLKIIVLAGEVVVDYSLRLKSLYGYDDTWVAGYSNEMMFGYIPSKRVALEGGYEARGGAGGAFSTAIEETIIEKADQVIERTKLASRP